ncbi:hypothetical protein [Emcibacter nanhaiensis]|uniref:Uncharacterized protein n=1 Tax=Emcibacter nanhaiensis TaxID=1505037 RepID=A0A501PJI0_9PROT|nr:hypothetical protein [Emcibacter nanhaiensis]TPD60670.1 hypothetical protein FIV46_08055 [Emcibacter nanhaiensis]
MTKAYLSAFLAGQVSDGRALLSAAELLAARVGGLSYSDMTADPALWGSSLVKATRLLGLSGLILGFDPALAAAAAVKDDPLEGTGFGIAVEAFSRLVQTEQEHIGCIAAMAGPLSLAQAIHGDGFPDHLADLKQVTVSMAEAFCKSRPDLLLFREGAALFEGGMGTPQRKAFNTLKNMASYFSVPVGIFVEGYDSADLPSLAKLKVPFILLGADRDGNAPEVDAVRDLAFDVQGIGVPLPFEQTDRARELAGEYASQLGDVNYLYTAMNELTPETDLEAVLALVGDLNG